MRILMMSNWLPPIPSGSSFYASSLAQSLANRGHEVMMVTFDWGGEYASRGHLPYTVRRLPIIKLPRLGLFYNLKLMGLAFTPSNIRSLKILAREFRPDIWHHVNHIFDSVFLSSYVARWAQVPLVGSLTTLMQHERPWKQRAMEACDRWTVGQFGLRQWDRIISLDLSAHQYVGHVYGQRIQERSRIIPFGVRVDSMPLYEDESLERSRRPTILMVGHIHPFRNPVQLVRAMKLVLKDIPDARLILAGRLDLAEPAKVARHLGLTEGQVTFLGETPHDETVRLMKTSHVFASWVTGTYRGLGTAAMEAMLCETPVVNDLPEDLFGKGKLRDGENIVLVNSRDPGSIADAIIRLLNDSAFSRRIGTGGKRFVKDCLSWDRIATEVEGLYEEVLTMRGKRALDCTSGVPA